MLPPIGTTFYSFFFAIVFLFLFLVFIQREKLPILKDLTKGFYIFAAAVLNTIGTVAFFSAIEGKHNLVVSITVAITAIVALRYMRRGLEKIYGLLHLELYQLIIGLILLLPIIYFEDYTINMPILLINAGIGLIFACYPLLASRKRLTR